MKLIGRAEWGAKHEDGGGSAPLPAKEWWLHHSVTIAPDLVPPFDDDDAAIRTLEAIGEQRFGRGISYTYPITPVGRVYIGHSMNRLGAHTGGRNSIARAICFVGNYDVTKPTAAQIEAAAQLLVAEYRAGRSTRYTLNGGHQQAPGASTACPGRHGMAAIPVINARATAILAGAPPEEEYDVSAVEDKLDDLIARVGGVQYVVYAPGDQGSILARIGALQAVTTRTLAIISEGTDIDEEKLAAALAPTLVPAVLAAVAGKDTGLTQDDVEAAIREVLGSLGSQAS